MPRFDQILVRFSPSSKPLSFDPFLKMEGEQPLLDEPSQESVDLREKHSLIQLSDHATHSPPCSTPTSFWPIHSSLKKIKKPYFA